MGSVDWPARLVKGSWLGVAALSVTFSTAATPLAYSKVALSGDAVDGSVAGTVYSGYFGERPSINNAGDVVYIAGLTPPTGQGTLALFGPGAGAGSAIEKLYEVGDPAPGFEAGSTINFFTRGATINNLGDVAFIAEVNSPSTDFPGKAFFGPSAGPGSPTTVLVRRNDPNLGYSGNISVLPRDDSSQPAINDAGQIAFFVQLGLTNIETLYGPAADGTGYIQLTSERDTPPGVPPGRSYELFIEASTFLDTGEVAYEALLEYRNESGQRRIENYIFAASEQGVRRLGPPIAIGDPVPGRTDGAVFSSSTSALSVNAHGDIIFYRGFVDGQGQSIRGWYGPTDGPGSEVGLVFQTHIPRDFDGEVIEITGTGPSSLNNNGDFALLGSFEIDPSQPFPRDRASALITVIDGEAQLIVKEGSLFDVDPGLGQDLRLVTDIGIASDSFNDAGQVLFELDFEDGTSGLFVATVPEPGSAGLFVAACWTVFRRRHRPVAVR